MFTFAASTWAACASAVAIWVLAIVWVEVAGAPAAASSVDRVAVWLTVRSTVALAVASTVFSWAEPVEDAGGDHVDVRRAGLDGLRGGSGALRARDHLDDLPAGVGAGVLILAERRARGGARHGGVRLRDVRRVLLDRVLDGGVDRRGSAPLAGEVTSSAPGAGSGSPLHVQLHTQLHEQA